MIEIHDGPKQSDFCELAGLLATYLQRHEDGADRLAAAVHINALQSGDTTLHPRPAEQVCAA